MFTNKKSLLFWSFLSTSIGILNIFVLKNSVVGIINFLIYILSLGTWVGALLPTYMGERGRKIWGVLLIVCLISFLNVLVYYPYKITEITSTIILILPLLLFFLTQKHEISFEKIDEYLERSFVLGTSIFLILEIILLHLVFKNQTTEVLQSPWMTLNASFFIIYALATAFLLWIIGNSGQKTSNLALTSLHLFITYSIAPIIYKLGYGYDGFIHRATEVWIKTNGFILPKEPFYMGQYGLVVWLSHITNISIHYIDIFLVPVLASIFIPFVIHDTLKRSWKLAGNAPLVLVWLIPFIFYISLHLTTPHNLVLLFVILCIFSTLGFIYRQIPTPIPLILALSAVLTHPLLGVPLFVFVLGAILIRRCTKPALQWIYLIALAILLAVIPATMFSTRLILSGHEFPELANPFVHIDNMIDIFRRPYWYTATDSIILETLYNWQRLISPLIVMLALIGFFVKKEKRALDWLFPITTLGFWISAWLLRTWIVFPNVIDDEQTNYPLRVLIGGMLFLIPWSIYGIYIIGNAILKKFSYTSFVKILLIIFVSLLLMVSLYLAYPQNNQKVYFPGFNVTGYDVEAITWIHNQHTEYNYVVLSNPITAVAALEHYSFAKYFDTVEGELFYYSIPSGGPLYSYYQRMLYDGQKPDVMQEVMRLTNTKTAYLVINSYWKHFNEIVEGAKKTADAWQIIKNIHNEEKIYIFIYNKNP
ncbi:MAG: hypothetical protein HYV41_00595 [Candidatus Magasanikbacteria bacterium]|nr:hypothetical protein [Candidatus Magasanikbacteria bacterium]